MKNALDSESLTRLRVVLCWLVSRSCRFVPPELQHGVLVHRPGLVGALLGRWEHRVTLLRGGPGLGKTTLLAQAIAESRLAPRGEDVWVGVEPYDSEGASLAQGIMAALSWDGTGSPPS